MASRSYILTLGLAGVTVVALAGVAVAHPGALNDWPYASSNNGPAVSREQGTSAYVRHLFDRLDDLRPILHP